MLNQRYRSLSWLLALSLVAVACGDDDDDTGGTGGTSGKGGSNSTGGKAANGGTTTGGTSAKGGTGGTTTTGGKAGTGGVVSTGGTTTTGGTDAGGASGDGGVGGVGGAPEGGSTTGGTGTGGSPQGGTAGTSTGGTAGEGDGGIGGIGGSDAVGGAGGEGGEAAVQITIVNPSFDAPAWADPPSGWTETGDGAACSTSEDAPRTGLRYLNLWANAAYEVTWSQVIASVPNGNYSLSIWHQGGAYIEQYAFARGYDSVDPAAKKTTNTVVSSPWVEIVVSPIPVTNGQIEIGVYSKGAATNWSHFDDVTLTKLP